MDDYTLGSHWRDTSDTFSLRSMHNLFEVTGRAIEGEDVLITFTEVQPLDPGNPLIIDIALSSIVPLRFLRTSF